MLIYERQQVKCEGCPLAYRNRVWGRGSERGDFVFIGEAPGKMEDENKEPFIGAAGKLLRKALREVGITSHYYWLTNVINCRPKDNKFTETNTKIALKKHCNEGLYEELEYLKGRGYKMLIPLGNNPCNAFVTIPPKITKVHGQTFEELGFLIMPTYHPSYIVRNGGEGSNLWDEWLLDLQNAQKELLIYNI